MNFPIYKQGQITKGKEMGWYALIEPYQNTEAYLIFISKHPFEQGLGKWGEVYDTFCDNAESVQWYIENNGIVWDEILC